MSKSRAAAVLAVAFLIGGCASSGGSGKAKTAAETHTPTTVSRAKLAAQLATWNRTSKFDDAFDKLSRDSSKMMNLTIGGGGMEDVLKLCVALDTDLLVVSNTVPSPDAQVNADISAGVDLAQNSILTTCATGSGFTTVDMSRLVTARDRIHGWPS